MTLLSLRNDIIRCTRCPRLRSHSEHVGRVRKAAHRDESYWAKPVPGFGDPDARLLVLGLAPAAHGANRTGRVFTGDGSGDFLMRAMHRHGFATIPTSRHVGDGLRLTDAYITAAVRCAPPRNKPTPRELAACLPYLEAELDLLARVSVVVTLGRIAFDTCLRVLATRGSAWHPKPAFHHSLVCRSQGALTVIASYHPSRQNTNTGKLTAAMLGSIFRRARRLVDASDRKQAEASAGLGPTSPPSVL